ncbi:hypothetical protein PR202_gb12679 [Eleusine coracana subsp. coracana]|uniref:Uncharacterized protein n=1 Tax=Eleusine coracana subsp. coracana TaxID=191504 RepID=A0AAV5EQ34_ELECO|nr:hypothetical protein PR202_gb12679 [Eleusine coracana subsp. coracana]
MQVRMTATSSSVLLLLVLWFLAGAMAGEAVQFRMVNAIQNTETHENFDREVGVEFAGMVLAKATELAWQTLGQHSTSDRKKFDEFDGNGHANKGLLGGIAELVQMRSGYTPSHWAKKGDGERWDEMTLGVTAQFLQYCDKHHPGFVAQLGRKMKKGYNDRFFADITGKTVSQLWKEYKASNRNTI